MTETDLELEFGNILKMGYGIVVGVGGHTGFHSDGICSESWFGNIPEMVGESCVPLQFPCWNPVLWILFQTVLNLLHHQYSLMASLNMKSQRFLTLNWITDAISVNSFIWSGGSDMKVPMKKPLGYLPMNLLMLPTLSLISIPNILPNPALFPFNKSVCPFLFLSIVFLSFLFFAFLSITFSVWFRLIILFHYLIFLLLFTPKIKSRNQKTK